MNKKQILYITASLLVIAFAMADTPTLYFDDFNSYWVQEGNDIYYNQGTVIINSSVAGDELGIQDLDGNAHFFLNGSYPTGTASSLRFYNADTGVFHTLGIRADADDEFRIDSKNIYDTWHTYFKANASTPTDTLYLLANELVINEGGNPFNFRVESDGKANMLLVDGTNEFVGIATGTPEALFQVGSSINTGEVGHIILGDGNTNIDAEAEMYSDNSGSFNFRAKGDGALINFTIDSHSGAFLVQDQSSNQFLWIGNDGFVGLGTDNPVNKLHVDSGTTNNVVNFSSTDGTATAFICDNIGCVGIKSLSSERGALEYEGTQLIHFNTTDVIINDGQGNKNFRIEGDTDEFLFYTLGDTDRIGVGISSPLEKLHVDGDIIAEGTGPDILLYETDTSDENYQFRLNGGELLIQTQDDALGSASTQWKFNQDGNFIGQGRSTINNTAGDIVLHPEGELLIESDISIKDQAKIYWNGSDLIIE